MEVKKEKSGFSQYMGLTFLIGFGFFTMGLMDPLVGGIMTLDNVLQLCLIPLIAIWSDRTRTRIGRRMPFIIVMLPISAVLFSLFPRANSLLTLIILIFIFNMFKTSVRGPVGYNSGGLPFRSKRRHQYDGRYRLDCGYYGIGPAYE